MNRLESIMNTLDYLLGTKKKRHIAGGILVSTALLFGGLAITVMSLRGEDTVKEDDYMIEEEEETLYDY